MNRGDYVGRALQVHNDVGFGRKESSIARALLYTLAPTGSVIIAPDALWLSESWIAMLAGAAARGSQVCVVSASLPNAPNGPTATTLQHDVLERLLDIRQRMGPRMRNAGGDLRLGFFVARAPVTDARARAREIRDGLARAPWIRELIPFDATTLAVLDRATTQTGAAGGEVVAAIAHDDKAQAPQLHQKTQLIARPGAIAALVRQPGWDNVLADVMRAQTAQAGKLAEQLGSPSPDPDTTATRRTDALLRGYERSVPEAERKRVSFYFSLGTQNQDPRGQLLDAETTLLVSGFHAAAGLVDLYYIMARSDWIASHAQLDRYLPPRSSLMRRLAHLIRFAL
jgi:hypothetical protein